MRRLLPDTLFGRTLVVLVVGLLVTHFASMAIYYSDRSEAVAMVGGGYVAERVATVVRLFEEAPANERLWLAQATRRPGFTTSWDAEPELPADAGGGLREGIITAMLALSLDGIDAGRIRLSLADASVAARPSPMPHSRMMEPGSMPSGMQHMMRYHRRMMEPGLDGEGQVLRLSVGLSDGSWLNLETIVAPRPPFWTERLVLSLLVMIVLVGLLAAWAVRRMTRPLEAMAEAADRLGRDMHAPPMPETGAGEARRAATAFNRMQERIRGLVDSRTRMLAAISHDLRTPITRLRLRAEFIDDEEARQKTLTDLGEMERMVASVLEFARDDAQDEARETVDLAALLQSVCDDQSDAGRECVLVDAPRTPFACRPLAMRRAISNLVDNAVAYGERARVSLIDGAGRVVIRVDDDGPGIPAAELARVFEPFYRLERSRSRETGGTGIGLCVVQTVAQAHGGEVRLANRDGGGLRAELVLPR